MQQIPKVGDVFPFFDDGKIKPTRLYKAKYDKKPVVFARAADGGWFSFDFPVFQMSGRLDVDGTAREVCEKYYGEMKL